MSERDVKWITESGIRCWSCSKLMPREWHVENDGLCIHCGAEIDDLDSPYAESTESADGGGNG